MEAFVVDERVDYSAWQTAKASDLSLVFQAPHCFRATYRLYAMQTLFLSGCFAIA